MEKLEQAVRDIKSGQVDQGRRLLAEIIRSHPENERAWLWLAASLEDRQKRRQSLERVLEINPDNQQAQKWLRKMTPDSQEDPHPDLNPNPQQRSFAELVKVWANPFQMTVKFLKEEKQFANTEDTILGVLIYTLASVLLLLVTGILQLTALPFSLSEELPGMGVLFLIVLIGSLFMTPISFYLSVALQYLGARLFGGKGNFISHAYLQAVVLVPITILAGVISLGALIPVIGFLFGLAGFGLSIFGFILSVRLVMAAHDLSTGKALGALFIPPVLLIFLSGCLLFLLGPAIGGIFDLITL